MIKKIIKLIFRYLESGNKVGTTNESARLIWLQAALAKIPSGNRILDAGAGELNQKKFCPHLNYVSQDFAQYEGVGDGKGLQTKKWDNSKLDIISDITAIPESDASFDAIMCIEVFEHLPDPLMAIKEFSRLLRKDGILILTAPFCSLTHFAPYHFSTGFNRYYYEKHLADNSFKIVEIVQNGNYFEYIAQEIRRIPNVAHRYSGVKLTLSERIRLRRVLNTLSRLSIKDKQSDELLCFGYHIKAIRL
jgi:ubiquinone/menaquinone biosynthesis C-methylase UbiE